MLRCVFIYQIQIGNKLSIYFFFMFPLCKVDKPSHVANNVLDKKALHDSVMKWICSSRKLTPGKFSP